VAISGLGSIARQHAAAFGRIPGVERIGFDPSERMREAALADGVVERVAGTLDDLLDAAPDALVIAAPDPWHVEQLRAGVAHNIPTLVEKPLADSLESAADAARELAGSGVPVLVGYVLRHRRVVETVRTLVAEGAIGDVASFQVMLGAYGTIPAAASRFATAEPDRLYRDYSHEWDYLRWILAPVTAVTAVARTVGVPGHLESPNTVDALLELESGIVGAAHIDYVEPAGTRTLHVAGTEGVLFADIRHGRISLRRAGEGHERRYDLAESPAEPLARQAAHLLDVAAGDAEPRVTLADGVAALAVADALARSATTRAWTPVAHG
jgi:predicted dehydrogenase